MPNIFNVWEDEGWVEPVIEERFDPDQTILSLEFKKKVEMATDEEIGADKNIEQNELQHAAFIIDMDIQKYLSLMNFMSSPRTRKELQEFCGYKSRDHFRNKILIPLINAGKIDMTIPDKPQSSKQRYVRHSKE